MREGIANGSVMRKQETAGFFQWIDDSQRYRLNGKSPQVMSVKKLNEQVSNRWTVAAVCGGYESAILRFHPDCSFCSVYTVFSFRTCHLASREGEWLHYAMRCDAAWELHGNASHTTRQKLKPSSLMLPNIGGCFLSVPCKQCICVPRLYVTL